MDFILFLVLRNRKLSFLFLSLDYGVLFGQRKQSKGFFHYLLTFYKSNDYS